ncbi:MAG: NACHT C-terminal helical domain 2-containing protein, partial [Microcystaceae cyanobacterium]
NTDALALAFADSYAYIAADEARVLASYSALADAYANAYADTYANAYADAVDKFINHARICEKFNIYRAVNLSELITNLEHLQVQVSEHSRLLEDRRDFIRQMLQTCLKALGLDSENLKLSPEELEGLDNYCYTNLLVVKCKKTAVRVSRQKWEEIENRMLLPVTRGGANEAITASSPSKNLE